MMSEIHPQTPLTRENEGPEGTGLRHDDLDVHMTGLEELECCDQSSPMDHWEGFLDIRGPSNSDETKEEQQTTQINQSTQEQRQETKEQQLEFMEDTMWQDQEIERRHTLENDLEEAQRSEATYAEEKAQWQAREKELLTRIQKVEEMWKRDHACWDAQWKNECAALKSEHEAREKTEVELKKKNAELSDIRKRWKQAAKNLEKTTRQGQNFYQATDQELVERIERLKYNISNLSTQYFGDDIVDLNYYAFRFQPHAFNFMPEIKRLDSCLFSKSDRSILIQALLWHILVGRVFGCALWAGRNKDNLLNLQDLLRPDTSRPDQPRYQAESTFQKWRATTMSLVLEATGRTDKTKALVYSQTEEYKIWILLIIRKCITFKPGVGKRFDKDGFKQDMLAILDDAINLDCDISRQAARVEWLLQPPTRAFDPDMMQLSKGEVLTEGQQKLLLVVAPGLRKTGRSTGEDFEVRNVLVREEVLFRPASCPRR